MSTAPRTWPILLLLGLASVPLVLMYIYLVIDTVTDAPPGSMVPDRVTVEHWRFLWQDIPGKANIWLVTLNTFVFATATSAIVLAVSSTAGYALPGTRTRRAPASRASPGATPAGARP